MSDLLSDLASRLDVVCYRTWVRRRELLVFAQSPPGNSPRGSLVARVTYIHRGERAGYTVAGGMVMDDGSFQHQTPVETFLDMDAALDRVAAILAPALVNRRRPVAHLQPRFPRKNGIYGKFRGR